MKSRIVCLAVAAVCLLAFTGCKEILENMMGTDPLEASKLRVAIVLRGIQVGGMSDEYQKAICQWDRNVNFIASVEDLDGASDRFDRWQKSKNIFRNVKSFEILEAEDVTKDGEPFTALVTVKINGRKYKMKVPEGRSIVWAR